ncbi:MAG TPA: hypothetical protein VH185_09660 [Mycobacterium sp.]|nr:hypothetical protein [Mycobacterium sp.]
MTDPSGGFQVALTTASVDIGHHEVTAQCGDTLNAPLDVVLVSRVGTGAATMMVIVFFLVTGVWFYGHRLAWRLPMRRSHA